MQQIYNSLGLLLFIGGMFGLPVGFGSAAAALPLLMSFIWCLVLLIMIGTKGKVLHPPRFQIIWALAGAGFFGLFALTAGGFSHLIYGFNTFAFLLALGVCWQFGQRERSWLRIGVLAALAGLLIGTAWTLYQYHILEVDRITAYVAGGSNLVARIAVLLAAFSTILLMIDVNAWHKIATYSLALGAATLIIVYSGSRGSLLALPLLFVLPLLFALPSRWLKSLPAWGTILVFGLSATGLIIWLDPNGIVTSTFSRLQSVAAGQGMDYSTSIRYQMWQVALQSFLDHPFIGTGWHSFAEVARGTVLIDYLIYDPYFSFHSDIANFAVAGGIVGLALYFILLFAPLLFWDTPRDHTFFRVRLYWAVSMPILYLVLGLTDMVMGFDYPTMFYAFSFAIIWGVTEQPSNKPKKVEDSPPPLNQAIRLTCHL